jgi:hypothetical protein
MPSNRVGCHVAEGSERGVVSPAAAQGPFYPFERYRNKNRPPRLKYMRPRTNHLAIFAALLVTAAVLGAVGASATTNPKRTGNGGTITCFNDQTLQYSDSEVGPPLKSFSVDNPCDTWMQLYFARQAAIVQVISVPPGTAALTVTIDALRTVGLANMQYDSSGDVGSINDTSACSSNLAGIPTDVIEADGSLQQIAC